VRNWIKKYIHILLISNSLMANSYVAVTSNSDATGNVWVVCDKESDAGRFFELYYLPYKGEMTTGILLAEVGSDATSATISVNDKGDGVVIWVQPNQSGRRELFASTLLAGASSWGKPVRLSSDDESVINFQKICLSQEGKICLIWNSYEPKRGFIFKAVNGDVWGNWFPQQVCADL
jgi:hypothetical protein